MPIFGFPSKNGFHKVRRMYAPDLPPGESRQPILRRLGPALAPFAPVVVWGVLFACMGFVLFADARYGMRYPFADDWDEVLALVGDEPITLKWLWSQHNEHRIFLPRLVFMATLRLTNADYRAPVFFNIFALGALSAAMLRTAKKLRGRTRYADALFPLQLLQPLQAGVWWSYQVQFVSSSLLLGLLLLIMVRREGPARPHLALLAGVCTALLPLCGANGLVMVPALALWLSICGLRLLRSLSPPQRLSGLLLITLAATAIAITGFYFHGYEKPSHHNWPHAGLVRTAITSAHLLTAGLGPGVVQFWPLTGIGMGALLGGSTLLLLGAWRLHATGRPRSLALLSLLAAVSCVALSVGWGRGGRGWEGLEGHYASSILMFPCGAYFIWELYAPPLPRRLLPALLCGVLALVYVVSAKLRIEQSVLHRPPTSIGFEEDLHRGLPADEFVRKHILVLRSADTPADIALVTYRLRRLRAAGMGIFGDLRD